MISGAAQADIAVLVISARKGEFESGFDKGGQTREHAMLAKTAGVRYLVIAINKMDDPSVNWDEARYNDIKEKVVAYCKQVGFKKEDMHVLPISGFTGENLITRAAPGKCDWYDGEPLVPYLDNLPKIVRLLDHPLRMPIADKFKDMGTYVMGKLQSGVMKKGLKLLVMPNSVPVTVEEILMDDQEVEFAQSGDNIKVRLKGIEEEDVMPGYVLCSAKEPCRVSRVFDAQVAILEYKSIICSGFNSVVHVHTACGEIVIKALICMVDKKTGKPDETKMKPRFVKQGDICICRLELKEGTICVETFKDHPSMGRFTLRDEGKTIGIGKVLKLVE